MDGDIAVEGGRQVANHGIEIGGAGRFAEQVIGRVRAGEPEIGGRIGAVAR